MTGIYGKVPIKGDFISRGLNRSVIEKLDFWFQEGLQNSRQTLNEQWLELYSVAPIWHFYLPPGILSDLAWIGIWMPSADRVTRNFPLVVLDPLNEPFSQANEIKEYFEWFMECEDILLSVFDEGVEFDSFCNRICEKVSYRKIVKEADIDDVFEIVGAVEEAIEEQRVNDNPVEKQLNIDQSSASCTDPFKPSTPFEKALMLKVGLLENILRKLCDKALLNYEQELEGFISNLTDEQKAFKNLSTLKPQQQELQSSGNEQRETMTDFIADTELTEPAFTVMKNLVHLSNVYEDSELKDMGAQYCIWLSEGSENIGPQLVFSETLPSSQEFHQFLSGFNDV